MKFSTHAVHAWPLYSNSIVMPIPHEMKVQLRRRIVDAMAKCQCLEEPDGRKEVVRKLSSEISNRLNPGAGNKLQDLEAIDRVCEDYFDGTDQLIEVIRFNQRTTSRSFQELQAAYLEVEVLSEVLESDEAQSKFEETLKKYEKVFEEVRKILGPLNLPETEIRQLLGSSSPKLIESSMVKTASARVAFLHQLAYDPNSALSFLELLRQKKSLGIEKANQVRRLMEGKLLGELFGDSDRQLTEIRENIEKRTQDLIYLLVTIEENLIQPQTYDVRGWRWEDKGDRKRLPLEKPPLSFHEIEDAVREMVRIVEQESVLSNIIVELFVDRKLFTKDIWHWQIHVGEDLGKLLVQFPVVLRWLNRAKSLKEHKRWRMRWNNLQNLTAQQGAKIKWEWFSHPNQHPPGTIIDSWVNSDRGICLALGYVPHDQPKDNLSEALNTGTPIVLWFCGPWANAQVQKMKLAPVRKGAKITELPLRVWEIRQQARKSNDPDHIGRHLILFFDNPDRIPTDIVPEHLRQSEAVMSKSQLVEVIT